MRSHLLTVLAILALGGGAAIGANAAWYKMDWFRKPAPAPRPTTQTSSRRGFIEIEGVLQHLAAQTAIFVDAREDHEYQSGRLRGAIRIPSSAIYDSMNNLYDQGVTEENKIIIYCGGGECEASHNVAEVLRDDFGYLDVSIYEKGWEEIESSGRFLDYVEYEDAP